jgi:prophage antirepressor-like protein
VAVPEQERKLKSFEGWIERTINKKIQKQTHLRNYVEVEALLEEKELKLTE